MKNIKTQGFVLIDVDVVALNNAGKNTQSNNDNAIATKSIRKNGRSYVYVSGQAWRYWWREALQKNLGWSLSPITRDGKIAFTNANPISYADDDVFGYMRAAKDAELDENGEPKKDKRGNIKMTNVTVTRVSPLKNSAIISAASVRPEENWSSMARQEGDAVPYEKQEYSAIMKGMFSLDLSMIGTFSNYDRTGYKNLSGVLQEEALENGASEIDDPFVLDAKGKPKQLIRLDKNTRQKRAVDTIQALKTISGGAMQTNNMGDVTPKFVILATTTSGNHPFSHVVGNKGQRDEEVVFNFKGLLEVLKDYKETFTGSIFIGHRSGFMDEIADDLKTLEGMTDIPSVKVLPVNEAIDQYCKQMKLQIE
ncbi:CRISPR-associated autoregulator, Cst2 family [Saccharicrinis carchari]|uniref:CRISPR-associated autoregulator, Cst2 family n=1 Tax=Saccharicrinis carchari TaxID=1168039 RepID=A0A521E9R3_SACCC|nr:type I-B CRISPR-associated protein Cas7/Cst2/DevR [Saccharicrinis carchari]SMO80695.1 CRISPR-associated autoregulator, Cst2 family [Saccharicrinis carchari]